MLFYVLLTCLPFVHFAASQVLGVNINGLPTCAQGCLTNNTGSATGCAISDIHCLCSSISYINALSCCLEQACSAADQKSALAFDIALCDSYNVTIPDFLGCSPLSATGSRASIATAAQTGGGDSSPTTLSSITTPTASTVTSIVSALTLATGGPVAHFTGDRLLTGTCANPVIATATQPSGGILEFPWVGCSDANPACCPFNLMQVGPLSVCPQDYSSTSSACCPSGWSVYTSAIAGQTPCYTTPAIALNPPTATSSTGSPAVSVISNQLFTLRYQLAQPKAKLAAGAIAGIAIGAAAAGLVIPVAILLLLWRRARKRRSEAQAVAASGAAGAAAAAAAAAQQPIEDSKPGAMFGSTNRRPVLETVSSYVPELPSPPPGSPPPHGKWEGSVMMPPPHTPRSVRSLWTPTSEQSPEGGGGGGGGGEPVPPVPTMELPGSTYLNEHHPAFHGGNGVADAAAVEKGEAEETGIAR